MRTLRPAAARGNVKLDWLESRHTFSFGEYHDPQHVGFSDLRVINEDAIAPGTGFGMHPHRDMEIVTFLTSGALRHQDSLGNTEILRAGEVQRMSAGRGVVHSEWNASEDAACTLLQIWILPSARRTDPSYEQRAFDPALRRGVWRTLVAPEGDGDALRIGADARMEATIIDAGSAVERALDPRRSYWLQVVRGKARAGESALQHGDGLALSGESALALTATTETEALLFDLRP